MLNVGTRLCNRKTQHLDIFNKAQDGMTEPTEKSSNLKSETLEIAFASGLEEAITEISTEYSLTDFDQKSIIPIPTDLIQEGEYSLSLSKEIDENLEAYKELILDPETAFEFPFLITGKTDQNGNIEAANILPLNESASSLNNGEENYIYIQDGIFKKIKQKKESESDIHKTE